MIGIVSGCTSTIPAPTIERVIVPLAKDEPRVYQYRVKSGDTLYAISQLHGISVDQIAQMNDLSAPYVIYPGDKLVVDHLLVTTELVTPTKDTANNSALPITPESNNDSSLKTARRSQGATSGVTVKKLPRPSITSKEVAETNSPKKSVGFQESPNSQRQQPSTSTNVATETSSERSHEQATSPKENTLASEESNTARSPKPLSTARVATTPSEQGSKDESPSKSKTLTDVPSSPPKTVNTETTSFVARTEPLDVDIEQSTSVDIDSLPKGWSWPVSANPTNSFGKDDGLNYYLNQGNEVRAAASGRVTYAGVALSDFKYMVLIKTPDGYVIQYDFNVDLDVQENDLVSKGQKLAKIVKSGKGQHNTTSDKYRKMFFAIRKKGVPQDPNKLITTPKIGGI